MKTTSTMALLAAAGFLAGGVAMAPAPARAADLGGDCCADLESRVAELEATTARKGNRKVSLTITGRVNMNIMWWNENSGLGLSSTPFDRTSDVYFGNVTRNETEFVFKGDAKISKDLTGGFSMESYDDPDASGVDDTQTTHQGANTLAAKTAYVFLKSASLGEVRLGQQYGALHDGFYADLGVDVIGKYAQTRDVAKLNLRDTAGNLVKNYQNAIKPIEDTRDNGILYITPAWNGFTAKANYAGDDTWGASLGYNNKFGTVSLVAALGYENATELDGDNADKGIQNVQPSVSFPLTNFANNSLRVVAASASVSESGSGLYLTGEYSRAYANIAGRQDATNWMAKGGWQKNVSGLGTTAIYLSYFKQDNLWQNNTSGHVAAVGIDQAIDAVASDLYLQYQRDSFDTDGVALNGKIPVNSQSFDAVIGGMIIRF